MTRPELGRRDFLGVAAVSTVAAAAAVWRSWRGPAADDDADGDVVATAAGRLGEIIEDREGAAALGELWLARHARPPTRASLVRAVAHPMALDQVGTASDPDLRRLVAAALDDDYAAGRVVAIRGWLLSLTEVRLCSILALAARPALQRR